MSIFSFKLAGPRRRRRRRVVMFKSEFRAMAEVGVRRRMVMVVVFRSSKLFTIARIHGDTALQKI